MDPSAIMAIAGNVIGGVGNFLASRTQARRLTAAARDEDRSGTEDRNRAREEIRAQIGALVEIKDCDTTDTTYPWLGSDDDWYTNAGWYSQHGADPNHDLIELVKDENGNTHADSATLAEETLSALGWTFDDQARVEQPRIDMVPNALDVQVGGTHYKDMTIQPWAAFDSWLTTEQHVGYLLGTAIAYLARFNSKGVGKGGLVDVEKATHTLQRLVEVAKKGSANED